jgi:hypothetical protein
MCRLSWNVGALTFWNPQGLSRPVQGLFNLFCFSVICIPIAPSLRFVLEASRPNLNFLDFSQHVEAKVGTVQWKGRRTLLWLDTIWQRSFYNTVNVLKTSICMSIETVAVSIMEAPNLIFGCDTGLSISCVLPRALQKSASTELQIGTSCQYPHYFQSKHLIIERCIIRAS